MYYNGQIVHNFDTGKPCKVGGTDGDGQFAWNNIPPNTTHYIELNPKYDICPKPPKWADGLPQSVQINGHMYRFSDYAMEQVYSTALPKTIKEAKELLKKGLISPAPLRPK